MSDDAETRGGKKHCPHCGTEVKFDVADVTAMGSEGREYIRGAARCPNPECMFFNKAVRPV